VCRLPRVSRIKSIQQDNNECKCQTTTIQSRSFEAKHLQDHEETLILSLVVNLPIAYSTTSPRNNTFKELRYHLQERKNKPRQELKSLSHNESKLCYDPKEGKTSSIYTIL
jgi:hypothetical protein